jgi:hypothetical protein
MPATDFRETLRFRDFELDLAGNGYPFIAPVEVLPATSQPVPAPEVSAAADRPAERRHSHLVGGLLVAVLPFENLSGGAEREYLADGLAEETIASFGIAFYLDWDWPAAEAAFRRAVALDPGHDLARLGRAAEARDILRTLESLPAERYVPPSMVALVHLGLGERDAAFARARPRRSEMGRLQVRSPVQGPGRTLRLCQAGSVAGPATT